MLLNKSADEKLILTLLHVGSLSVLLSPKSNNIITSSLSKCGRDGRCGGFLDLRMVTGTLSRVTNHCNEALMSSVIIWALEVLSDVFICGRSFLKWKSLLCFSQWFCVLAFFGYRKICFSFRSSLKYLWYLVVIFHQIITFLFSFTRMPIFPNRWLFFHKRRLAEFWCCCFYEINSYGDHMLSTSWKDHGRGL